jgi:hypothetical protein
MLLLDGKPVADTFLSDYAQTKRIDLQSLILKKPATFKLSDSFFQTVMQREMKSGKLVERPRVSPHFALEPTIKWMNPQTGLTQMLTYTTNFRSNDRGVNVAEVEPVVFEYGFLTVTTEQNDLYFWLNNHALNQTNPKYKDENNRPQKPFLFREVLPDLESTALVEHERLVAKLTLRVTDKDTKGYINDEALMYLVKSYGFGSTVGKGRKDAEKFILNFIKKNPTKVESDLTSAATEIRAVLADAIHYGVIVWDAPYYKFVDLSKGKRTVNNGIICQVTAGLEPIDYFVNWMREKDNTGVYAQLKKEVDSKKYAEVVGEQAEV